MANDALELSLRAEIDKHFNARLSELRAEMSRIQDLLNETVTRHKSETDAIISKMIETMSAEDDAMNAVIAEHLRNAETVAAQAAAEKAAAEAAAEAAARAEAEKAAAQAAAEEAAAKAEAEAAARVVAEKAAAQAEAEKAEAQAAAQAAAEAAAQAAAEAAAKAEAEKAEAQAAAEEATAKAEAEAAARVVAEEVAAKAEAERAEAQASAEQAIAKAEAEKAEAQAAAQEAAARAEAEKAEAQAAAEETAKAAAEEAARKISENISLLRNAIVDLGKQKSQAEILKTLVGYSASLAPRVAFFVVKEGHTKGWRAFGFEDTVGNDAVNQIVLSLEERTPISESVKSQTTSDGTLRQFTDDDKLLESLGSVSSKRMVSVPLIVRSRSVAVLYADSGNDDENSINVDGIEALVRVAGLNVEMLATSRAATHQPTPKAETVSAPAVAESVPTGPLVAPEPMTEPEPAPEPVVAPEPAYVEEPTPVVAEAPVEEEKAYDLSDYQATEVETFESMPVQTYAPVETPVEQPMFTPPPTQQPTESAPVVSALGAERRFGRREVDLPIEVAEEERRYHNEARRFARLLVSEIKLYNEPKVKEGRDTSDLYHRLREAIDRSREMYDKRVSPQVATKFDYFHYELVNTLAEGDEGKLGGDYPGASV